MKFRLSYILIVVLLAPSFTALADAVIADGNNVEFLNFTHDHEKDHEDHEPNGFGSFGGASTASLDCHHCNHCHSLSFFFLSTHKLPSFYAKHRKKHQRYRSEVASIVIPPAFRPPIT